MHGILNPLDKEELVHVIMRCPPRFCYPQIDQQLIGRLIVLIQDFVEASDPSPYIEVSVMDLNLESPEEDTVEINPLYRFGDVLGRLFDRNIEGMEQTRQVFFDVCMHYIVQLDLRPGLSGEGFFCSLIRKVSATASEAGIHPLEDHRFIHHHRLIHPYTDPAG